jgi:hypothetical protein
MKKLNSHSSEGESNDSSIVPEKEFICGIKSLSRGKRRFFPLIVNEEHADCAYQLLCEELIRADQLSDQSYESPVYSGDQNYLYSPECYTINPSVVKLPPFNSSIALRVISAVMNSMVVMFSTNANEGKLSDPALVGFVYFIFFIHKPIRF